MSNQVCRDYVNGHCRFGSNCRFFHPPRQTNNGARSVSAANAVPLGGAKAPLKYQFNEDSIRLELRDERPRYILSSFAPSKYEPNLFFGYDLSPEELRWKSVPAIQAGKPQEYVQEEAQLTKFATDTITSALSDLRKTTALAEKLHDARYPNGTAVGTTRPDGFSEAAVLAGTTSSTSGAPTAPRAFGQTNAAQGGAFGSSAFGGGASTGAFGSTSAGQPAQGGAFGQPSFGKPSAFGSSSFGSSSTPTTITPTAGSAFGASAFGQKSTPTSSFGSTTTPAAGSGFGHSAFGQKTGSTSGSAFGSSAFGQSSSTGGFGSSSPGGTGFGTASMPKPAGAFGSSAFGSTTNTTAGTGFGQSAFGSPAPTAGFGQTPNTPSGGGAFGQSGFGKSSFGQSTGSNAFGQTPSNPSNPPTSAFGSITVPAAGTGFGQSALGAPKPPTTAGGSGFGSSAFGSSASGTGASGFGAFSSGTPATTFSTGGFGAFGQSQPTGSGFGNTSAPTPPASGETPPPAFTSSPAFTTSSTVPTSAFGSGFGQSQSQTQQTPPPAFTPHPSTPMTHLFATGTDIPDGWNYDDPWSVYLPSVEGNEMAVEKGGWGVARVEEKDVLRFRGVGWGLGEIPMVPPCVELRA